MLCNVFVMLQEYVVQKLMMFVVMYDGNIVEQKIVKIVIKDLVIFFFFVKVFCLKLLCFIVFQFFIWFCMVFEVDLCEVSKIVNIIMVDVLLNININKYIFIKR